MANTQTNVYRCTAYLQSQLNLGNTSGEPLAVIADSPADALAVVASALGADLVNVDGPTLAIEGAYVLSTPPAKVAPQAKQAPQPTEEPESEHHHSKRQSQTR